MILFTDTETSGLHERTDHLLEVAFVVVDDNLNELSHHSVVCLPVGVSIDELVEKMPPVVRDMHTKNGLLDELRALASEGKALRRHEAEISLVSFLETAFKDVPPVEDNRNCVCGKWKSWHYGYGGENTCGDLDVARDLIHAQSTQEKPVRTEDQFKLAGNFRPATVPALSKTPLAGSTVSFDRRWLQEHMPELLKLVFYRNIDVSSIGELAARWAPAVYEARPQSTDKHRALDDARGSIELLQHYRRVGFLGGRWGHGTFVYRTQESGGALCEACGKQGLKGENFPTCVIERVGDDGIDRECTSCGKVMR